MRVAIQYPLTQKDQIKDSINDPSKLGAPCKIKRQVTLAIERGARQHVALDNPSVREGRLEKFALLYCPLAVGTEPGNYEGREMTAARGPSS